MSTFNRAPTGDNHNSKFLIINLTYIALYFADAKIKRIGPIQLKDLICHSRTHTDISPLIFVIDGLPHCRKSEALSKLLHTVIPKFRKDAVTNMGERAGISFYELAAVAIPPPPFDRLTYSVTNKHNCYLYDWKTCIANGIALINVWDIGMNKAVYRSRP